MGQALEAITLLKQQMERAVVGQAHVVEGLLIALLCNGNVLLEGLPGTAKTRSIKSLAKVLDASLGRIQFTPDLLPADVTGTEVYHSKGEGSGEALTFQPGPIFNNLVLADEINRAPAKVQSALLEAMEERQITVAGKTYSLPELFMVLATQNPIEQEGTYPLPEAQMDRFLMKIAIDYPEDDTELDIMRLVRGEESQAKATTSAAEVSIPQQAILEAREQIHKLQIAEPMERYIVALVMATRDPARYSEQLASWISVGSSPRASIALDKCARAHAWMQGRDYVSPEDIQAVAPDVLGHRVIVSYTAQAEGISAAEIVREILQNVAVA
jgi:MoxR-like ATPase